MKVAVEITLLLSPLLPAYGFNGFFSAPPSPSPSFLSRRSSSLLLRASHSDLSISDESRRALLSSALVTCSILSAGPREACAAVGSLPELQDANAILQGVTIRVADKSQEDAMIKFLDNAFDFQVLRKRIRGSVVETWMGFGPEQLSIPDGFTIPVSSLATYGGHASIHIVYDSKTTAPIYRIGDDAPGNNIAYLQVGVPTYRISQMVEYGGNILDAYGIVNVVSPSGLPIRGIVGISPDPIMFIAINCADVQGSKAYYEQLGFVEQEYPYARPNRGLGQFEPPQPNKSVYMAPSGNCMGVLLLPSKKKRLVPNNVLESLNIVYNPTDGVSEEVPTIVDPSGIPISFQSAKTFDAEEVSTR